MIEFIREASFCDVIDFAAENDIILEPGDLRLRHTSCCACQSKAGPYSSHCLRRKEEERGST